MAQVRAADSALAEGRLARAESLYYAAARSRPRDPAVRIALGRFLAARGKPKVGAVLLEEARQFGGPPVAIAAELAPMYRMLGDYRALATLARAALTPGQRAQVAWLASHPSSLAMPESTVVRYAAPGSATDLGTLELTMGDRTLSARIDPLPVGLVLDVRARSLPGIRVFPDDSGPAHFGMVGAVGIAGVASPEAVTLGNVPVTFERLASPAAARLGIDVIVKLAPRFEPRAGRVVLHSAGTPGDWPGAEHLPTLLDTAGIRVLRNGGLEPITSAAFAPLLRQRMWAIDGPAGELLLGS